MERNGSVGIPVQRVGGGRQGGLEFVIGAGIVCPGGGLRAFHSARLSQHRARRKAEVETADYADGADDEQFAPQDRFHPADEESRKTWLAIRLPPIATSAQSAVNPTADLGFTAIAKWCAVEDLNL
jgi:hypothetical protein